MHLHNFTACASTGGSGFFFPLSHLCLLALLVQQDHRPPLLEALERRHLHRGHLDAARTPPVRHLIVEESRLLGVTPTTHATRGAPGGAPSGMSQPLCARRRVA
eukprot:1194872-Prorocentrum_minimum.AAC.2